MNAEDLTISLQGDHIFEKLNSLSFPWDFQGIFKLFPEKHEREKFPGIHFHWQLCDISYVFPEFSRFFCKNNRFPWVFPEILTIFQIPWIFQVFHVFQVCGHPGLKWHMASSDLGPEHFCEPQEVCMSKFTESETLIGLEYSGWQNNQIVTFNKNKLTLTTYQKLVKQKTYENELWR